MLACIAKFTSMKKGLGESEATEKGLKFLRPEKKSQIFEKKIS